MMMYSRFDPSGCAEPGLSSVYVSNLCFPDLPISPAMEPLCTAPDANGCPEEFAERSFDQ
jgi:hypothetical protein